MYKYGVVDKVTLFAEDDGQYSSASRSRKISS